MKPFRVLIFITGVFTILFAVSALFPENGIHIAGDIRLKFASPDQIIGRDTVYYADIRITSYNVCYTKLLRKGLDIIPSHIDLVGAEIEMLNMPEREFILKKVAAQVSDRS